MMTANQLLTQLLAELSELSVNPQLDLQHDADTITFADLQLDSLDILTLAMQLEDAFNIEIDIQTLPRDKTLPALCDYLSQLAP